MISPLLLLLTISIASAAALSPRATTASSVPIQFTLNITQSQITGCENPSTLKQQFSSRGASPNLNYNQLSAGIAAINSYFLQRSQSSSAPNNCGGFVTPEASSRFLPTNISTIYANETSYSSTGLAIGNDFGSAFAQSSGNSAAAVFSTFYNSLPSGPQRYYLGAYASAEFDSSRPTNATTSTRPYTDPSVFTYATTDAAYDGPRRAYFGPQDTALTGSCAADSTGASAFAQLTSTLTIPFGMPGQNRTVTYTATAGCQAGTSQKNSFYGTAPPTKDVGSSASGMQASPSNSSVAASVSCQGKRTVTTAPMLAFQVSLSGNYSTANGFVGTLVVVRTATANLTCS